MNLTPHLLRQMNRRCYRSRTSSARSCPRRTAPIPQFWPDSGLHAAWLGHTSVLLKIDGVTILTDPVFSTRAGIGLGPVTLGLKRLVEPALALAELPKIDVILLSHAHMDHFDIRSLRRLESPGTTVVTAARTADLLRVHRYAAVHELGWGRARAGRSARNPRLPGEALGRAHAQRYLPRLQRLHHRGRPLPRALRRRYRHDRLLSARLKTSRPFDLAIMPVGAYNPWIHSHCNPEQAWQMAQDAGAEFFLPVHHQTFTLSREPYFEPIERVCDSAGNHPDRVALSRIGQQFQIN